MGSFVGLCALMVIVLAEETKQSKNRFASGRFVILDTLVHVTNAASPIDAPFKEML
jgi:hypothetical protein